MQVHFLVLDGAPQPFGENVVPGASASVHADFDTGIFQALAVLRAGEVATLVAVPDFGRGLYKSIIHRRENEIDFQRLVQRPTDDMA